jgi:hypothetical protein
VSVVLVPILRDPSASLRTGALLRSAPQDEVIGPTSIASP